MAENNMAALKKFFSTEEKPVSLAEMREFWESLTPEEKHEFITAELD